MNRLAFVIGLAVLLGAPAARAQTKVKKRIAHLNVGLVAMSWVGESGAQPSNTTTVADRQTVVQLVGAGTFVRPNLRLMLSLQLAEVAGGGAPGASSWALGAAIPWVGWHFHPRAFLGAGPLLAARSYGDWRFDAGLWTALGAAWPLGRSGLAAGVAVQVPILFKVRTSVTVTPAAFIAYRF